MQEITHFHVIEGLVGVKSRGSSSLLNRISSTKAFRALVLFYTYIGDRRDSFQTLFPQNIIYLDVTENSKSVVAEKDEKSI
ncbi:hypothetical protein AN965_09985 [Alkalicoccobacillus plakortidis]|uniref:Uncharacterized protein n=1 Tax=Alkalicoccobacillus plakortidis TaxID=444060 RepID=A0A9D5DNA8_9BACI|nr:hypothetical protein AN965_09985 [Alkalicoccobacillus plakortidis]